MKSEIKLLSAGLLTAVASSLCCITPILAIVAGSSGLASTFSWLDPFRPFLIGFSVLVLGFAWYQKLKPMQQNDGKNDCQCGTNQKQNFMQSKTFLSIVTIMSVLLLSFPSYAHIFFTKTESKAIIDATSDIKKAEFIIKGMTCTGCEQLVKTEINKLKGIVEVAVSYADGNAVVKFDSNQSNIEEIEKAIKKTGYNTLSYKIIL